MTCIYTRGGYIPGIYAAGDICKYDGKVKLIASGFGEAQTQSTINDPTAKVQPCHGSSML